MNLETMIRRPIDILVVDDSEDAVVLTREAFEATEALRIAHVAGDGMEALRYLRHEAPFERVRRPGLILLDLNMPGLNGIETLRAIKRDPALRHIPVIVLTVSDQPSDIRAAYAEGAAGYVRKPDDFEAFAGVVRELQDYWTLVCRLPS
ncbi:MAG TPA: response regulator [Gemmatimonadales bacterium]|nr:response regulator [Gemmatimonadales bacterium]